VNLATSDVDSPRAFAKKALQRPHHERWVDRAGTPSVNSHPADDRKVGELARAPDVSKQPLLRFAAELPPPAKAATPFA
jgi:hypothetical protein